MPVEWKGIIKLYLGKEQHSSVKTKVYEKDLLEGTLMTNLQKTFVMPIYKELSNVHILPVWKQKNSSGASLTTSYLNSALKGRLANALDQLAEPQQYIRKIGEHFVSFIHKLD